MYNKPTFDTQYENYIGGELVAHIGGQYFDDISSIDGSFIAKVARSDKKDRV